MCTQSRMLSIPRPPPDAAQDSRIHRALGLSRPGARVGAGPAAVAGVYLTRDAELSVGVVIVHVLQRLNR